MKKIFSCLCPADPVCGAIAFVGAVVILSMICWGTIAGPVPETPGELAENVSAALKANALPEGATLITRYADVLEEDVDITPEGDVTPGENMVVRVSYSFAHEGKVHKDSALILVGGRRNGQKILGTRGGFGYWSEKTRAREELKRLPGSGEYLAYAGK